MQIQQPAHTHAHTHTHTQTNPIHQFGSLPLASTPWSCVARMVRADATVVDDTREAFIHGTLKFPASSLWNFNAGDEYNTMSTIQYTISLSN